MATTPVMLGVTLPAVVVVAVGLTVAPVGGAKAKIKVRFWGNSKEVSRGKRDVSNKMHDADMMIGIRSW